MLLLEVLWYDGIDEMIEVWVRADSSLTLSLRSVVVEVIAGETAVLK